MLHPSPTNPRKRFDPADRGAVDVWFAEQEYRKFVTLMRGINVPGFSACGSAMNFPRPSPAQRAPTPASRNTGATASWMACPTLVMPSVADMRCLSRPSST